MNCILIMCVSWSSLWLRLLARWVLFYQNEETEKQHGSALASLSKENTTKLVFSFHVPSSKLTHFIRLKPLGLYWDDGGPHIRHCMSQPSIELDVLVGSMCAFIFSVVFDCSPTWSHIVSINHHLMWDLMMTPRLLLNFGLLQALQSIRLCYPCPLTWQRQPKSWVGLPFEGITFFMGGSLHKNHWSEK